MTLTWQTRFGSTSRRATKTDGGSKDEESHLAQRPRKYLRPFLERDKDAYLFSPREAEAWHKEHRPLHYKAKRKTPIYPSELRAREAAKQRDAGESQSGQRANATPLILTEGRLSTDSSEHKRRESTIPHWFPLQLRHNRATEVRRDYGLDACSSCPWTRQGGCDRSVCGEESRTCDPDRP